MTSGTLFGENFICGTWEFTGHQTFEFNTEQTTCDNTAKTILSPTDSNAYPLVTFYLQNTGFTNDILVTGKSIGNDINATFTGFTGNLNFTLVEVTPTTGVEII
ncbi:hypothetical protein [Nitrosarchaeum koreense]|uniref:Uncharacterized protein n=1 Tax=Nitrosarchaeum koreense MY1 TaxID=1001994 RepID=F9CVA9_9ARCH|nr:hypothetical protein [Nitrosarchaeum koreense]EGP94735.1 hypothetical protein MY1_1991 [Nitrosarchaeum koreense MY1]